jgi:hypothetical protein
MKLLFYSKSPMADRNARDSVELASDAATPYVAGVIGQKISAGAKQEQKP